MKKQISTHIAVAYSQCPRKAYLLLTNAKAGKVHEYVEILDKTRATAQAAYLKKLREKGSTLQSFTSHGLDSKASLIADTVLETENLRADCGLLTKVATHSTFGHYSYEPMIFVGTHTISKEQKLALIFTAYVLEQVQQKAPEKGVIVNAEGKTRKVKVDEADKTLLPVLEPLKEWLTEEKPEEPTVILNKHCPLCQFRDACRAKANQEDNLSLLDRMTPKTMRKLERKGIFTVTQLSYTFRPRKRKKRTKNPPPVTHKLELQALAIREKKIYIQEMPEIERKPVELFLDIEGIPDQNVYYLIGLLVCEGETNTHHSFWADELTDEAKIWQQFVEKASEYPAAPIYHYGNYEVRALKKLANRYETDAEALIKCLVNVNGFIYGKVYFPTYSNRLKDLGQFIGAEWSSEEASGLQSLVWRHYWEDRQDGQCQETLAEYNREDCTVLKTLLSELAKINDSADIMSETDFVDKPKSNMSENSEEISSQFDTILKFAHANYDQKKISFRPHDESAEQPTQTRTEGSKLGYQGQRKIRPKPMKTVWVPSCTICPNDPNAKLRCSDRISVRLIIDLVLTKNGIRKTITEYKGHLVYCHNCNKYHTPPTLLRFASVQLYGHGLKSWYVYHRIALRIPYDKINESYEEQFDDQVSSNSSSKFVKDLSKYYIKTESSIEKSLLASHIIHADETPVSIRGVTHYVWVFTDGENNIFKLGEGREAQIAHEFLSDYNGILISDFYAGYDSIDCVQQKCWVHLIRDMNTDLRLSPLDKEYENFILEVRNLIIPIMESVQRYGLKRRNLNKHQKDVDKFYKKSINDMTYKSELALKYQKRFTRYRESLFTFIHYDNVPWHNNTAERSIRHLARQRAISGFFHKSHMPHYLRLLGIHQTCRFQKKSFFKFLFSGETDLDEFQKSKRSRQTPK